MNKFSLITGASSGIGLELAKLMAMHGHNLLIVARNKPVLDKVAKQLSEQYDVEVTPLTLDLSEPNSAEDVYDWAMKQGDVEILVNNAGFGDYSNLVDADWAKLENMINLNVLTLTALTRLFAPEMVKNHSGRIMNVASTASFLPGPMMATYYATKAYVKSFSVALAQELNGTGVSVTTLCPGATQSGFQKLANMESSKLISGKQLTPASDVAAFGYKSMMKRRGLVVFGMNNRLMVVFLRLIPESWSAKLVQKVQ